MAFSLMSDIGNSGLVLSSGAKFAVSFPVVYHYLGGLRHLVWDNAPEMLTNMDVEKTSYGLIGASVLVSGVALVL